MQKMSLYAICAAAAKVISVPVSEATEKHENVPQLDPEMVALTKETIEQVSSVLTTVIGFISESAMRYVYLPESGSRSTTYGNWAASILARIVGADPDAFNFYHVIPFRKQDGKIVKGKLGAYVWALGRRVGETRKVTAQAGTAGVKLTWDAVEGANGYVVLSKSGSDKAAFNPQVKTTNCVYVDTKAESGITQFYWVYAVYNNAGGQTVAAGKASPYAWAVAK